MKRLSPFTKSLSFCFIIIFFTNSTGQALKPSISSDNPNCGEWYIESLDYGSDDRLSIVPLQKIAEMDCGKSFTISNNTNISFKDIFSMGGYAMELSKSENNSTANFLLYDNPYIVPDLEIDVEVAPKDLHKQANVSIEGRITQNSILYMDLPLFLLRTVITLAKLPKGCVIPDHQLIMLANRTAPILGNAVQLASEGRITEADMEFSRVKNIFLEKAAETAKELSMGCLTEFLLTQVVGNHTVAVKLSVAFLSWVGTMSFDILKYGNTPATINLSYIPTEITLPSTNWIVFENKNNLWLIHPDGDVPFQITDNENNRILTFKWSPDGNTLAYSLNTPSGNTAIFLYDTQTSSTIMLISDDVGGGFDWSLTGKQIIYDTPRTGDIPSEWRNKGIWVINIDNGKTRQIVKPPKDHPFITNPKWSSEGSYVIFTIPCFEVNCVGYGVANFETGKSITLPVDGGTCEWSPRDLQIACTRMLTDNLSGKTSQEIVILDENGNILNKYLVLSTTDIVKLVWSPSEMVLALGYYSDGKGQADLLSLNTGEWRKLASGIPSDWSPDGMWLLTWESGLDVPLGISVVNINSGEVLNLPEGVEPFWQP